jgi:tripartite-type tricarboxylate transporter receptor subunit TctC
MTTKKLQTYFRKSGELKGLAVSTPQRLPGLPQVTTVADSEIPGFSFTL